ncbi:pentatricopeptide repeat-containing protein at1g05600 [Phtheirospermum japonicum]|uniref:Pentatricopeptide repeat-containing protein at1g05600 n=1 Tax=Phtheirospermum japonicum TaxID=374723 RepID=A0A830DDI6_9LAMI|nr:pentatricopeptide repeat-containing protein at1g05600 [Phtheirospermum japonicum]
MSVRWPRLLTPTHLSQLIRIQKNPLKALDIFNEAKTRYPSYRHNGAVYATMIRILGNSGRVTEMKEIIKHMKNDSCECRDSLFADVIRTYVDAGLSDEAISLFNTLPEFNCVNFTKSFNTLLEIMVNESKLETCYHIFVGHCRGWEIKSRIVSLKLLMHALCKLNRSDLALHVFQEMSNLWCYPDRETYRILMRGLCEDRRLTEATHLLYLMFWRISQKGCGADISIYRTLLEALCDNGEVEEAVELLENVLRKGLKAPKKYRKHLDLSQVYYKDEAGINYVKGLINEALIRGGVPSSDGYTTMAVDLYSEQRIFEGDKVLEEMLKRGFKPSLPMYEAKVAALFSTGEVDEAVGVVEREMIGNNCVPTVRLHNIVIKGLCDVKESDWVMRYFEKMSRRVGCVPDKETYTYLVDGLCRDGKYLEASRMMEKMLINSYWPGDAMYTKLIKGLCSIGKTYKAVMWLEEMISQAKTPEISVWCSLVSSVCCESQVEALSVNL